MVDSAETKNHRPGNGAGPKKAPSRARNSGTQSDGEALGPGLPHPDLSKERESQAEEGPGGAP
ncbi:LLGL scribble cell polarity complex component 2 [Homo sapiens]|nr:LLGL scribble cell polarity complex component 2 [Homo sapiens]KAI4051577.1 LLGL scribble cell polarity complex component 2 [Homo sapiens]